MKNNPHCNFPLVFAAFLLILCNTRLSSAQEKKKPNLVLQSP
jgi:hypothetical protein